MQQPGQSARALVRTYRDSMYRIFLDLIATIGAAAGAE
jgi:hypothetical protein